MNSRTYNGEFSTQPRGRKTSPLIRQFKPLDEKMRSLEDAIRTSGLKDGMTISFHHHFRAGDYVLNEIVNLLAHMGYKDLTLASSSLSAIHTPLIKYIEMGVITEIHTSGLRGELGHAISKGLMNKPVIIRSHGGRARAIEAGDIKIDVAFLGATSVDKAGNASGMKGEKVCGALGYAMMDAEYADHVIIVSDKLVDFPNYPCSIDQTQVDQVVIIDNVGDSSKIASGATRFTRNPKDIKIAKLAAKVIESSGYLKDGFTYQTGSGGASLAVTRYLKDSMLEKKITCDFALGGITKPLVDLHREGLIKNLFDVQSFDLTAARSLTENDRHFEISASQYANPHNMGAMVNYLDIVVLSALEIDKEFNVNVITGSDGCFMGASGGHCDTAASAKLTVIVAPLFRGRIPTVVEKVETIITPGSSVDVLVTDRGIAVNPKNTWLIEKLKEDNLPLLDIDQLVQMNETLLGQRKNIEYYEEIVGIIEYRDGSIIDYVKKVKQ
jgi:citrate lyase subunit alpha/citrate CoA-transferase